MKTKALLLALSALLAVGVHAQQSKSVDPHANENKEQRDQRMKWWREARFGMFIHWGVYSVPAGTYDGKQIVYQVTNVTEAAKNAKNTQLWLVDVNKTPRQIPGTALLCRPARVGSGRSARLVCPAVQRPDVSGPNLAPLSLRPQSGRTMYAAAS